MPTADGVAIARPGRARQATATLAYTAFLAWQTLGDGGGWACDGTPLLELRGLRVSRGDLLANLVAYVPLGLLMAADGARLSGLGPILARLLVGALAAAAISVSLEFVQACQPQRVSSWIDVLVNVAGALAGLVAGLALRARVASGWPSAAWLGPAPLPLIAVALVGAWFAHQTAPWLFSLDLGVVRANLAALRDGIGDGLQAWPFARHAAAWTAMGLAIAMAMRPWAPAGTATMAAMAVTTCAQVPVAGPHLSVSELAGLAVALPLLAGLSVPKWRGARPVALLLAATAALVASQWEPRPAVAGLDATGEAGAAPAALGDWHWWPAVGRGENMLAAVDATLLFAWYALAVALVVRRAQAEGRPGWRWLAPASVAVALAIEVGQMQVPGRYADTSGPVMVALAWLCLRALAPVPAVPPRGDALGFRGTASTTSRRRAP